MKSVLSVLGVGLVSAVACSHDSPAAIDSGPTVVICDPLVSPSSLSLPAGGTAVLTATICDKSGIHWSSSDTTRVAVDQSGKVIGLAAGTVTIIASSLAEPTVRGAAVVSVGDPLPNDREFLSISSITTSSGLPARLDSIAGIDSVHAVIGWSGSFQPHSARLVLNDGVKDIIAAEVQAPQPTPATWSVALPLNTAMTVDGKRAFSVGGYRVFIASVGADGSVLGVSPNAQIVIRDP